MSRALGVPFDVYVVRKQYPRPRKLAMGAIAWRVRQINHDVVDASTVETVIDAVAVREQPGSNGASTTIAAIAVRCRWRTAP
jgi:predicted phosphoribosyltransferase